MTKKDPDAVPPTEAARRRDEGLKRMLKTPPKRHKDQPKKDQKKAKKL